MHRCVRFVNLLRQTSARRLIGALVLVLLWYGLVLSASAQAFVPNFQHKAIVDGDDGHGNNLSCPTGNNLYKCQYHGRLYGHWNDTGSNTSSTFDGGIHDLEGHTRGTTLLPLCLDGTQSCPADQQEIVVVALGFSNWTKEVCGDQFDPAAGNIQANYIGVWPNIVYPEPNIGCDPNAWSFANQFHLSNSTFQFVDCAIVGAVAKWWQTDDPPIIDSPPPPGRGLYGNCINILYGLQLDPRQVQVVLFKDADSGRSEGTGDPRLTELPASGFNNWCNKPNPSRYAVPPDPDACVLIYYVAEIARRIVHDQKGGGVPDGTTPGYFPNTKMMFVHSRI